MGNFVTDDSGEISWKPGGRTAGGVHYAKTYQDAAAYPGFPKVQRSLLSSEARGAVAYPPRRNLAGIRLSKREHTFVGLLSCKSRVVFWLYYKLKWPARRIAEEFRCSILDQHDVYIRNRTIKMAMLSVENQDKRVNYDELRAMFDEGANADELAAFYGLSVNTVRKHLRGK